MPQGVRASSPLANFYLAPLDTLTDIAVDWVRWMDDITISAERFADARRILDAMERRLYDRGLTLNSGKTSIRRAAANVSPIPPDALVRKKEATRAEIAALLDAGYLESDDAPEPADIDLELALEELDELLNAVDGDALPDKFQSRMTSALRDLESLEIPHRIEEFPLVLTRAPDLTFMLSFVTSLWSLRKLPRRRPRPF